MAINVNPGIALRQIATYNSSGNFIVPTGVTSVFVSVHSSSGGGASGQGPQGGRYNQNAAAGSNTGGAGGAGIVSGAWVQVSPGTTYAVVVGAGGAGGTAAGWNQQPVSGAAGGTSSFDGSTLSVVGGAGGTTSTGTQASASGLTNLSSQSPTSLAMTRTSSISNQNTGATVGGNGGAPANSAFNSSTPGNAGAGGQVHIYL